MTKLNIELDLDSLFGDCSVEDILVDELKNEIRLEIKRAIKSDKELHKLISSLHKMAVKSAISKLGIVEE